jgi:hypothetical protein
MNDILLPFEPLGQKARSKARLHVNDQKTALLDFSVDVDNPIAHPVYALRDIQGAWILIKLKRPCTAALNFFCFKVIIGAEG